MQHWALFHFIFQEPVQIPIRIPILTESTAVKVAKKRTIRHEMVLFAMAVISESIANAAKETITRNAQIRHANQVCFNVMIFGVRLSYDHRRRQT